MSMMVSYALSGKLFCKKGLSASRIANKMNLHFSPYKYLLVTFITLYVNYYPKA